MIKKFLECGKIVNTHGIKGELKVEPWADNAEFLKNFKRLYLGNDKKEMKVISSRVHKDMALIIFDEIDDMNKAIPLKGKILYILREDAKLKDGEFFWQDLIGIKVYDADDENICYGEITEVDNTGATDLYYIKNNDKEYIIPAISQVVKQISLKNDKMLITPLEGLFDDEN